MKNPIEKRAALTSISRLTIIAAVFVFTPPGLHAAPLAATSLLRLEVVPGDGHTSLSRAGLISFTIPGGYTTDRGSSWRGVAAASTEVIGGRPLATAKAESFTRGMTDERGTVANAPGEARAGADLSYQVLIVQIAPPPIPLLFVPTEVSILVSAFARAVGDPASNQALASATATVAGSLAAIAVAIGDPDGNEETERGDFDSFFIPGQAIDVHLQAVTNSKSGVNQTGLLSTSAVATAFADPVFSFDQEAFDELARMQGFAPFDLSTYFAFEQSPFLTPGVPDPGAGIPEPGSMALVLAGGLFLAIVCRLQRLPRDRQRS